jgi:magnesium transporter
LVTPTYYVYFTSSTIITSAILFRGFKGTVTSIITVVMGFFVICAGVVLLQLSKSAKDVPDTAVFAGDLDQLRTIAEQEQPESEPKADAIRGTAAIVRRFSTTRQKWEIDEVKRLRAEKLADLEPVQEGEQIEWDGLRRRRTTYGTNPSVRSRGNTATPFPAFEAAHSTPYTPQQHPPLGMSHFPSDLSEDSDHDEERPNTAGLGSSFFGSIRTRARSVIEHRGSRAGNQAQPQSPMHPVPLTEISIPAYKADNDGTAYYGHDMSGPDHSYGQPLQDQKTEYEGPGARHITIVDDADSRRTGSRGSSLNPALGPTPPPHSARRQFSFQNVFRKGSATQGTDENPMPQSRSPMIRKGLGARRGSHGAAAKGATEEERLGLVKGDTNTGRNPALPPYEDEEEEESWMTDDKPPQMTASPERESPRRDLTPPRRGSKDKDAEVQKRSPEEQYYDSQARKWDGKGKDPPPPFNDGTGPHGAFI